MSLRRVVLALAVLCLMAGVASAQFSLAQQVTCTVSSSSQPSLRAESTHELVGDVLLQCTGGQAPPLSGGLVVSQVPAVDITVTYGTAITSRQNSATAGGTTTVSSDIALVIDDPNSGTANPPLAPGYGPGAPYIPCQGPATPTVGASAPLCTTYDILGGAGYYVPSTTKTDTASPAANVYQGFITGGGQSVTFYGVPVSPAQQAGIYRRYRIVNVRVAPGSSTISASVATSGPNGGAAGVMLFPTGSTAVVGAGKTGFTYATSNAGGVASVASILSQCLAPQSVTSGAGIYSPNVALLSFSQSFANAAKPQGLVAPAALGATVYGVYNTESEIVLPAWAPATTTAGAGAPPSNGALAGTPGAADAGTRFKAVFAGLPYTKAVASTTIYVSLYNVTSFTADASTQGTATPSATLSKGTTVASVGAAGTEFDTFAAATGGVGLDGAVVAGTVVTVVPLTIASNGTATAVWEVNNLGAGKSSTFTFAVYAAYSSAANVPPLSNATVTLSAAPVQPATAPTPANNVQIPSFTTTPLGPNPLLNIVPCQTALLFPFVTTAKVTTTQHWETGIAIANTGGDPWNSVAIPASAPSTSTCTLSFFGTGVASGSTTFTPPNVTSPAIGAGSNWAFVASDPLATGTSPNVGFSGYMFAVCNFSYAHGFAFVEDNSPAGNAMGYLALVVNNQVQLTRPTALNGEGLVN
jgi:hypothetical protein